MWDKKGSYLLLIELAREEEILIGKLGLITFPQGFYVYVGSAMSGLRARINYHLRQKANPYWHIDYLLKKALIKEIILTEAGVECTLAHALAKSLKPIPGFGSSDCKCRSHLYFSGEEGKIREEVIEALKGDLVESSSSTGA